MTERYFQECLKKGQEWEKEAETFLVQQFTDYWVQDCHNHQVRERGQGPSFRSKGRDRLVTPDFYLRPKKNNPNPAFWIDAKSKTGKFTLYVNGDHDLYTSIDPDAYKKYEELRKEFNEDVLILSYIAETDKVFLYDPKEVDHWHLFNNSFDRYGADGKTPCYKLSRLEQENEI